MIKIINRLRIVIFEKWAFINYCTQRIGLWNKNDLVNGVNHIFKLQLTSLIAPIFLIPYIYFKGPSGLLEYFGIIVLIILIYYMCNKYLRKHLIIIDFEDKYNGTNNSTRIIYFLLGIFITVLSTLIFIFSFRILNFL